MSQKRRVSREAVGWQYCPRDGRIAREPLPPPKDVMQLLTQLETMAEKSRVDDALDICESVGWHLWLRKRRKSLPRLRSY